MPYSAYPDLWEYLKNTDKHVVMYGMGNGADKILAVADAKGITVEDFFASDGFVRGHSFHGKRVLSYSEAKQKYGADNMIVLLSFASSLPDVMETILRVADECELYAPDVPVFGDNLFDSAFYLEHKQHFDAARALLADEESVRMFDLIIAYKLTGDLKYLLDAENDPDESFTQILPSHTFRTAVDLGAYNGDSVRALAPYAPNLQTVYALEPDARNYRKLCAYAEEETRFTVHPLPWAAWSEDTTLYFDASGNRNAGAAQNTSGVLLPRAGKIKEVEARSVDGILQGAHCDFIKFDVEGSEQKALHGCLQTIKAHAPALLVSCYHRSEDLYLLPQLLHDMHPDYRLYLRRFRYFPAWDINLYAISSNKI
ncbi:MAG: FkbM family methyltransferase [Clostridia bacterium]|nr:FkbM family methyltransferase [Clostridia bacterium]